MAGQHLIYDQDDAEQSLYVILNNEFNNASSIRDHIGEFACAKFSSCCRSKLRHKEVSLKEMLDSIPFKLNG